MRPIGARRRRNPGPARALVAEFAAGALATALLVAGCGSPQGTAPASTTATGGSPPATTGGPTPTASLAAGTFRNPVVSDNFADPFILEVEGTYYAYATGDGLDNYPVRRSTDLVTWETLDDAMPVLATWASGDTWAPEVMAVDGRYAMYYTARSVELKRPDATGAQCVGVALADSPEGPFADERTEPLVCQPELGGTIDAHAFLDQDGGRYLVYKNDGNCCGQATHFFIRPLLADGTDVAAEETRLAGIENDNAWEGQVVEAPTLFLREGTYYVFYSGNSYAGVDYAVGYATAPQLLGPYTDAPENPILATKETIIGPGHQAIVTDDDGELWLAYHAWDADLIFRQMWIDRLDFEDGKPVVRGPTAEPQPVP
jgi:beta-xylosidase